MNRKIHLAALWLLLARHASTKPDGPHMVAGRLHRPRPPAHNIQLRRARLNAQSSATDVKEAKAGLLPTLSAAVTQSVQYRPFQEQTGNFVNGSIASSSSHKVTQSGSYGINASWVVWNGGKNRADITDRTYSQQMAELSARGRRPTPSKRRLPNFMCKYCTAARQKPRTAGSSTPTVSFWPVAVSCWRLGRWRRAMWRNSKPK